MSELDERTISIIKELHKGGAPYTKIAALMKITKYAVKKIVNPSQIERERERNRVWCKQKRKNAWRQKKTEFQALVDTIPEDTRTYSQRLMGEPLPGRSALDNRQPWKPKSIAIPIEKGAGE